MNWLQKLFYTEPPTTNELQSELKALVNRLLISADYHGLMRYQEILEELYSRGEEPYTKLVPKKDI